MSAPRLFNVSELGAIPEAEFLVPFINVRFVGCLARMAARLGIRADVMMQAAVDVLEDAEVPQGKGTPIVPEDNMEDVQLR